MTTNKDVKKKMGRPKNQPKPVSQLRAEAEANRLKALEARRDREFVEEEEVIAELLGLGEMKQKTTAELKELRRKAAILWDEYLDRREVEETKDVLPHQFLSDAEAIELAPALGMMTPERWNEAHGFLKPRRKNARKTKTIFDIELINRDPVVMNANKNLSKQEEELEARLIDDEIEKQKHDLRFQVGKRVRERTIPSPTRHNQSRFLY